jgi:hypothetical protein
VILVCAPPKKMRSVSENINFIFPLSDQSASMVNKNWHFVADMGWLIFIVISF